MMLNKRMNKRGQTELVIGGVILVGLVISGILASYNLISENRYIGDKKSNLYYDLKNCDTSNLNSNDMVNFRSLEEAKENGFKPAECTSE